MYKKAYVGKRLGNNEYKIFLWEEDDNLQTIHYENTVYQESNPEQEFAKGLNGESLKPIQAKNWKFSKNIKFSAQNTPNLHFHDMPIDQKFLVERYGTNDTPSTGHKELFFDIEKKTLKISSLNDGKIDALFKTLEDFSSN